MPFILNEFSLVSMLAALVKVNKVYLSSSVTHLAYEEKKVRAEGLAQETSSISVASNVHKFLCNSRTLLYWKHVECSVQKLP